MREICPNGPDGQHEWFPITTLEDYYYPGSPEETELVCEHCGDTKD